MSRRGPWNTAYASLLPEHADQDEAEPGVSNWLEGTAQEGPTLRLLRDTDVERMPEPVDLIKGLFPVQGLVVLYSFPGRGKTYVALDWAFCVATGTPWIGLPVMSGPVLYIAAEGVWTLKGRVLAWKHDRGFAGQETGVRFYDEPVNLMQSADALVRTVEQNHFGLVIFDTLAASMIGGDEDSAKDMGIVLAAINRIRKIGATVVMVHHTGKVDKAERGSVALRGAADTMIKIQGDSSALTLSCEKQRNGPPFDPISVRLRVVTPPTGAPSCVIEEPTASLIEADSSLPTWAPRMLQTLREHRELSTGRYEDLSNTPRQTFHRHLRDLKARGLVESVRVGRETLNRLTQRGLAEIDEG